MNKKDLNEIIADLEEFYECAGFENVYERVLKDKTEEELRGMYESTFKEIDHELEDWEERHARGEV